MRVFRILKSSQGGQPFRSSWAMPAAQEDLQAALDAGGEMDMEKMRLLIMRAAGTSEPEPEPEPKPEPGSGSCSEPADTEAAPTAEAASAVADEGEEVLQLTLAGHGVSMQVRSVMGLSVWAASSAAAERAVALLSHQQAQRDASRPAERPPLVALELGAGGALPSLLARIAGYQMLATDGDAEVMQLVQRNFALNGFGFEAEPKLAPRRLEWSTGDLDEVCEEWSDGFSLVVAADVFWNRESMGGFFAAAVRLLRRPRDGDAGGLLLLGMSDDLFLDLTSEAVHVAEQHGLALERGQEAVAAPSVATSAFGTVLREDGRATLLTFVLSDEGTDLQADDPKAAAVRQMQALQAALSADHWGNRTGGMQQTSVAAAAGNTEVETGMLR